MRDNHLIQKPIPDLIKSIAIPSSTGLLFNTFYNVVDVFYAGLISTEVLAGFSYAVTLFFIFFGSAYGFLGGVTALIGNSLGKQKKSLARFYAYQAISFSLSIAVVIFVIGNMMANDILIWLGAGESYRSYALIYFDTILFAYFALLLNLALNAILIAKGDSKSYRNTLILGFFLNIVLNPLFIYGYGPIPAMGLNGIAFSTVLIGCINLLYMIYKVSKTRVIELFQVTCYIPIWRIWRHILQQGWPSSLNMFVMSMGSLAIMFFISSYGEAAVAGYGIGLRVEQVMLLPALGINTAVLSITSNNYGAKAYDRVKDTFLIALKYSYIVSLFGVIVLWLFAHFIAGIFTDDPEVISNAVTYILIDALTFFAYSTIFIAVSTLQGIKQPKMIFYVSLFRQLLLPIPLFAIVVYYLHYEIGYLYWAVFLTTYIAAIWLIHICEDSI